MTSTTLTDLYRSRSGDLRALHAALAGQDHDGPFLMAEPEPGYLAGSPRVLIVGQEAEGWAGAPGASAPAELDALAARYRAYDFPHTTTSSFARFAQDLVRQVTGNEQCMWTNLHKFARAGKGCPLWPVVEAENLHFNVLAEELRILAPDVVIFLTGPTYDTYLEKRLPGVAFTSVDQVPLRHLARVVSPDLPHHAYRIYHPGYGNRIKQTYLQTIALMVKKIRRNPNGI